LISALLVVSIKPESALPAWAFALTLSLITMYVLANLGVIKYYGTQARAERNVLKHVVWPIISTVSMLYAGYRSVVPLPDPGLSIAIYFFVGYTAFGVAVLVYLKITGRDAWLAEAGAVVESAAKALSEA
jgi:hypothetical protein